MVREARFRWDDDMGPLPFSSNFDPCEEDDLEEGMFEENTVEEIDEECKPWPSLPAEPKRHLAGADWLPESSPEYDG